MSIVSFQIRKHTIHLLALAGGGTGCIPTADGIACHSFRSRSFPLGGNWPCHATAYHGGATYAAAGAAQRECSRFDSGRRLHNLPQHREKLTCMMDFLFLAVSLGWVIFIPWTRGETWNSRNSADTLTKRYRQPQPNMCFRRVQCRS